MSQLHMLDSKTDKMVPVWSWTSTQAEGTAIFIAPDHETAVRMVYGKMLKWIKESYPNYTKEEQMRRLSLEIEEGWATIQPVFERHDFDESGYDGPVPLYEDDPMSVEEMARILNDDSDDRESFKKDDERLTWDERWAFTSEHRRYEILAQDQGIELGDVDGLWDMIRDTIHNFKVKHCDDD